jgi:hypothetical protein
MLAGLMAPERARARRGDRGLDQRPAEPLPRRGTAGVGEHNISSGHLAARVHNRDPTLAQPTVPGAGSPRRRTGIEPAGDATHRPPMLATAPSMGEDPVPHAAELAEEAGRAGWI